MLFCEFTSIITKRWHHHLVNFNFTISALAVHVHLALVLLSLWWDKASWQKPEKKKVVYLIVAKKQREGTGLWSQNILPGHTPMTHSSK
jgi:hypothetical protein